jgi:hypothetical protein
MVQGTYQRQRLADGKASDSSSCAEVHERVDQPIRDIKPLHDLRGCLTVVRRGPLFQLGANQNILFAAAGRGEPICPGLTINLLSVFRKTHTRRRREMDSESIDQPQWLLCDYEKSLLPCGNVSGTFFV